jgi:hypothetical protein
MSESKTGASGSWWATLPGILTGIAAIITAVGGLITVLLPIFRTTADSTPKPPPVFPTPGIQQDATITAQPGNPVRVDEVWVDIAEVRRYVDQGRPFLSLIYRVSTRTGFVRHDPSRFVRLVAGHATTEPAWAPPPVDVPPQALQHIRVNFAAPGPGPAIFQFGVDQKVNIAEPK